MTAGTLYIISAPSGAGKTSLIKALTDSNDSISVSVSHTTRPPRPGEKDGIDYFFISQDQFDSMLERGEFLEHARVFDNYYGTSATVIEKTLQTNRDLILEIDWQGAQQVRRTLPDSIRISILPPSIDILEQRLRERGQDDDRTIATRMAAAREEISHFCESDYVIINNDFATALADLQAIIRAQRLTLKHQQSSKADIIKSLLNR